MSTEPESPPVPAGIYAAMAAIMGEVSPIAKAQRNNEQKFQYRGIDDVYNALNPRMAEHSVFMVPTVTERKTEERTTKSGNHMSCVTLTVEYRFFHADGSCITCTVMGEGRDMADKATNKAMAAAHKYALLQTFCIPTADLGSDDPDRETPEGLAPRGTTCPPRQQPTPQQKPHVTLAEASAAFAQCTTPKELEDCAIRLSIAKGNPARAAIGQAYKERGHALSAQTAPPPETPPAPPQSGDITPNQIKSIQTAYSTWSREDRLMDISQRVGRPVSSVKELAHAEASALLESFNQPEAAA